MKFRDLPYLGVYLQHLGLAECCALKAEDGKGQIRLVLDDLGVYVYSTIRCPVVSGDF